MPAGREAALTGFGYAAAHALQHRGPDASGIWTDAAHGVVLAHRRLSIVDLSEAGGQPMTSRSGRYVIVYNGEVYNFTALRAELAASGAGEGSGPRGGSDTEVVLSAIETWGLRRALDRFVGMFAFALWDRRERTLYLVRDRLGIKPLYYGWVGEAFVFGSELRAIEALPGFAAEVDRDALTLLLRHNCVPAPYSIYCGVSKLEPGMVLALRDPRPEAVEKKPFWSALEAAERGASAPLRLDDAEAVERLDALLRDAVGLRMIADVPLGAFLSGGIDSSTVVALMQAQSPRPVKTFSIGFHQEAYDEARFARDVARHLGTEHTELYVSPGDALSVIPRLPQLFDEPFADSSQIPTFLVSRLAREQVTVSLSGDGGDELFAGYNRHSWVPRIWRRMRLLPRGARAALGRGLGAVSPGRWDWIFAKAGPFLPAGMRVRMPGYKVHRLAEILGARSPEAMYFDLASHWKHPARVVHGGQEPTSRLTDGGGNLPVAGVTERMMLLDLITYLPDDILTKLDRASMAVSLEARVPLLDHRVVEFAWRLPSSMKLRGGESKWILRRVLDRYVPPALYDRPKMGFGIPLEVWLRGPLRDWAEALLDERRLREEGFFDARAIRRLWDELLEGGGGWQYHIWTILMFQAWHESRGTADPGRVAKVRSGRPAGEVRG